MTRVDGFVNPGDKRGEDDPQDPRDRVPAWKYVRCRRSDEQSRRKRQQEAGTLRPVEQPGTDTGRGQEPEIGTMRDQRRREFRNAVARHAIRCQMIIIDY